MPNPRYVVPGLAARDWLHCTLRAFRYSKAAMLLPSPPLEERARERRPSFSTLQPNRLAWNLLESCSKPQDREPGRACSPQPSPPREERGKQRASFGRWLCELERRINPAFRWWCQDAPMCAGGVQFNCRTSSPDLINTPLQRGVVRVRWLETVSTVSWLAWSERAIE